MNFFTSQLRQVLRRLGRTPLFTIVTLITLGAGVGANIAVFSVVEGVLLKPLPYPHAENLVGVWHSAPGLTLETVNMAPSNYFIYREQNRVFEDIGIYQGDSVAVTSQHSPEQVQALDVTDGGLVLGVAPILGRWFNRLDVAPNAADTVMPQLRLLAAPLRRLDRLHRRPRDHHRRQSAPGHQRHAPRISLSRWLTTRGVLADPTRSRQDDPWPVQLRRHRSPSARRNPRNGQRRHVRLIPTVWASFPTPPGFSVELFHQARLAPKVRPLTQDVVGDISKLLWVLMGSIGIVLLIACANVANLLLVRAEGRHQELAVRGALGASRWRIVREFLFESAVLGAMGSVVGLALAWCALRLLIAIAPQGLPRIQDIGIDWTVLAFTVAVSLLCSLFFGSIPAVRYAGARVGTGLREGGRSASVGRERHRTRNALVVIQVSLAFVLLICSGLMIRTFRALTHVTPGYDAAAPIQTLHFAVPEADVPKSDAVVHLQEAILHKIEAVPGVTIRSSRPLGAHGRRRLARPRLRPGPSLRRWKDAAPAPVQIRLPRLLLDHGNSHGLFGRDYTWADTYERRRPVGVVSEGFAREYFS